MAATGSTNPYRPDRDVVSPGGSGDETRTIALRSRMQIYGGFLGITTGQPNGETQRIQRRPELNRTVLSGVLLPDFSPPCGDPGAGSCSVADTSPGCDDETCCEVVCAAHPECCTGPWSETCAALVAVNAVCPACGVPGNGLERSCFLSHDTPGCDDPACCVLVCESNPFCCLDSWQQDDACKTIAASLCTGASGARSHHVVTADGAPERVHHHRRPRR